MRRAGFRIRLVLVVCTLAAGLAGCAAEPDKTYPLKGHIVAISPLSPDGRRDATVKHDDIPDFMPAMTMAYFVRPATQLDGFVAGDLITADVVFLRKTSETYLTNLKKTGHADLPPDARPVKILDVMNPGDDVPDAELVDQRGASHKLSDWRGQALAVTFVYSRCPLPDFCPLMDRHFADLQKTIAADPTLRGRAHLVSVSFDPAHDTPSVIATHASARGADPQTWSYLTGAPAAIERFTSRFGVSAMTDAAPADTITHNLRTAIVDRRGRLVTIYSGNEWTVDQILTDLRGALAK